MSPQLEKTAAGYRIYMIRANLAHIPQVPFPTGFGIRAIQPDEGHIWLDVERDAEPYFPIGDDLFESQFGYDPAAIPQRCYFVTNAQAEAIGTISGWYNDDFKGRRWGQIHWVALRRAYWGKGLGKAMLSYTLAQMAQWHKRAFFSTQTERLPAIKLYLDFGFMPDLDPPEMAIPWRKVKSKLAHPVLQALEL